MARERILITVKTYPCPSSKYVELVCIAGIREDGSWIRIYPYPSRRLKEDKRFEKYSWIEMELEKNSSDFRPESYRPTDWDSVKILEKIGTANAWAERKKLIIENGKVYDDIQELIKKAKDKNDKTSLAVFKPTEILDFKAEKVPTEWNEKRVNKALAELAHPSLFQDDFVEYFQIARKMPYKFSYVFKDVCGKIYDLMIEDWEICQLFWNCLEKKEEKLAVADVRKKYFDLFLQKCDLHFFLGTTLQWHFKAPNPFLIIGTFHPPKTQEQTEPELNLI